MAEQEGLERVKEEAPKESEDKAWYVIHSYSGYEEKVKENLEQRIESMGMQSQISRVLIPKEKEIEIRDGHRQTVERRIFPGYILVQMIMTEDPKYVVRTTPGVIGFVGADNNPTPMRPDEVNTILKRMETKEPRIKVSFRVGQRVRIIDGPFRDFLGTVNEIDEEKGKVYILVSFFGRDTPVELDFLQVEKT
ncbi:MAG: transcription termination/antitermination protein NusG [Chloroflexota bacterium]|nr:transcription termination/antitermination protein NusG [Chloroflexota bacterium]